jgi:hypothetical protein
VHNCVDQRKVRERLREVAQVPASMHSITRTSMWSASWSVGGRVWVVSSAWSPCHGPTVSPSRTTIHPDGRHPRRLEDHRPGHVAHREGHHRPVGADPERACPPVQQRSEDARRVEAGKAHPFDAAVGRHQRARVAVRQEAVVGDRRKRRAATERRVMGRQRDARAHRARSLSATRRLGTTLSVSTDGGEWCQKSQIDRGGVRAARRRQRSAGVRSTLTRTLSMTRHRTSPSPRTRSPTGTRRAPRLRRCAGTSAIPKRTSGRLSRRRS